VTYYNPTQARAKILNRVPPDHYKVEVWGAYPYDYVKTYIVMARKEADAAREAIREFNQTLTWGKMGIKHD
jgi:hypothetical protein